MKICDILIFSQKIAVRPLVDMMYTVTDFDLVADDTNNSYILTF